MHEPTWALIDIDPGTGTRFADILELARLYRDALDHLEVKGIPKITGKRGIQIWIPVRAGYTFADTRNWVETVSRVVGKVLPDLVSWQWYRAGRAWTTPRTPSTKPLVAPFSPRPAPGAPVSVPITWDDPRMRPDRWTIRTIGDRVHTAGDPLAPLIGWPQELPVL